MDDEAHETSRYFEHNGHPPTRAKNFSGALREPQFYRVDLETPRPTVALCRKLFGECLVGENSFESRDPWCARSQNREMFYHNFSIAILVSIIFLLRMKNEKLMCIICELIFVRSS